MVIAAESISTLTAVKWQPVRVEASADGTRGYSYGYAIYGQPQSGPPAIRVDRYIAYWRREASGWRIVAYAEHMERGPRRSRSPLRRGTRSPPTCRCRVATARGRRAVRPTKRSPAMRGEWGREWRSGDVRHRMRRCFRRREFITGPVAITGSFGAATGSRSLLVWHPVLGDVADSGDLGFTVGNAVFTGERKDGTPEVRYSRYLTVWKRQKDGSWRFVVDGGSARPGG